MKENRQDPALGRNAVDATRIDAPTKLMAIPGVLFLACLLASTQVNNTALAAALAIAGIVGAGLTLLVYAFLIVRHRQSLLSDAIYAEDARRQAAEYADFRPQREGGRGEVRFSEEWERLEEERISRYEARHGLFLTHSWRPSTRPGQVADVIIRLQQHRDGPLSQGKVSSVEYVLGPRFEHHTVVVTDPSVGFRLDESMWGPMLCLAKVSFKDGRSPVLLDRYINFEGGRSPVEDQS